MMPIRTFVSRSGVLAMATSAALVTGLSSACRDITPGVQAGEAGGNSGHRLDPDVAVASTGRVEGASEAVDVGAGVDGVVAELRVQEGDTVRRGDVLAVIDRRELHAELRGAESAAEAARQARARILRGSRVEERERADAEVTAAEAVVRQAESQHRRTAQLFAEQIVTEAERDEVRRTLEVSKAQLDAVRKRADLVKAPPLPEEIAKADAEVQSAEQRIHSVQQTLDKSIVRAPMDATVLRTMLRAGETFSVIVPQPILRLADTSRLRVRAEVDERDVARVFPGQQVVVRGDAWPERGVPGRVSRIGSQMGRKTVRSGDPAEKGDRDVLEVVVDLEREDPRLVIGLRVTALFLKSAGR